jgi:tRNA threonylcarbamoyladenosine biosynthesis protein TsaE
MGTIISNTPEQTRAFGRLIADQLSDGDLLAIDGDLGAGKTHFIQGIADGLGITEPVTSPTFTLVHEYSSGRLPLYHFDFYRFETAHEVVQAGFDDFLQLGGIIAIEWAGRFPELLPPNARWFQIECGEENCRLIHELDRNPTDRP